MTEQIKAPSDSAQENAQEKKKHPGVENLIPWKKGKSGNPKGRPKGQKALSTILREHLLREAKKYVKGRDGSINYGDSILMDGKTVTYQELFIIRIIDKAIEKGDYKFSEMIFDRMEGKPKQRIEMPKDRDGRFDDIKKIVSILTHGQGNDETKEDEDSGEDDR